MIEISDILLYMIIYGVMFFGTGYVGRRLKFVPKWMLVIVRLIAGLCFGIWSIRLITEIVNTSV